MLLTAGYTNLSNDIKQKTGQEEKSRIRQCTFVPTIF